MIQTQQQFRICDVHRLLDYDCEPRNCGYCGMCDAWICQEDLNRWDRRLRAAFKRKLEPEYRGLPDYVEIQNQQLKEIQNVTNGDAVA